MVLGHVQSFPDPFLVYLSGTAGYVIDVYKRQIYYPKGLHQQKVFEHCDLYGEELPVTTSICKRTLAIPVSPYLKEEDQDKIIRLIREKTGANA